MKPCPTEHQRWSSWFVIKTFTEQSNPPNHRICMHHQKFKNETKCLSFCLLWISIITSLANGASSFRPPLWPCLLFIHSLFCTSEMLLLEFPSPPKIKAWNTWNKKPQRIVIPPNSSAHLDILFICWVVCFDQRIWWEDFKRKRSKIHVILVHSFSDILFCFHLCFIARREH